MSSYAINPTPRLKEAILGDAEAIHGMAFEVAERPELAWFQAFGPAHPGMEPRNNEGLGLAVSSRARWEVEVSGVSLGVWAYRNSLAPVRSIDESICSITLHWDRPRQPGRGLTRAPSIYHLQGFRTIRAEYGHDTDHLLKDTDQPNIVALLKTTAEAVTKIKPEYTDTRICFSRRIENGQHWRYDYESLIVSDSQAQGCPIRHRVEANFTHAGLFAVYTELGDKATLIDCSSSAAQFTSDKLYHTSLAVANLILGFETEGMSLSA